MAALPTVVDAVVRAYRDALAREFPGRIARLTVFGSYARGEATEESDVDVLVVLDTVTFRERARVIDLATEIGLSRDLLFAPVVLSREQWDDLVRRERLLPREIDRDGVDI